MKEMLGSRNSQICSIKDITNGKTETQIIETIKHELGVVEDEAIIWNKMMKALSKVNFIWNPKTEGDEYLLKVSFCICVWDHHNYSKIEFKGKEHSFQPSASEALCSRRKGQKLTIEEKKEIYRLIEEGTPIKDIKETWQISQSTV